MNTDYNEQRGTLNTVLTAATRATGSCIVNKNENKYFDFVKNSMFEFLQPGNCYTWMTRVSVKTKSNESCLLALLSWTGEFNKRFMDDY